MSRNANITNYTFTALDTSKADECTAVIKNFLYETFKDEDLYRVTAMSEMLDSLNEQIAMMSGMLGGIAGISLLVAGVGVMDIMLVSVTERTREIGIRKSLGADKGTIMRQFVIEAAVTSSLGRHHRNPGGLRRHHCGGEQRWGVSAHPPPCRLLSYPSAYPLESDCCSDTCLPAGRLT